MIKIPIKTREEIKIMNQGGKLLSLVLNNLSEMIEPGVNMLDIEKKADELIRETKGTSNFKGYGGFPSSICISVNESIVHGIPKNKKLKEGDIVSLDLGIFFKLEIFLNKYNKKNFPNLYNGFHTDMAKTFAVGKINEDTNRLLKVTKKSLKRGIKKIRAGIYFGDISNTIQRYVEKQGFSVIRELCGHGIGEGLHEDPSIPNYGKRHSGVVIKEGMVFCIEPMVTNGSANAILSKDKFSYETSDKSLSAHYEHMVAVTKEGPIILTGLN